MSLADATYLVPTSGPFANLVNAADRVMVVGDAHAGRDLVEARRSRDVPAGALSAQILPRNWP
jgi:hypothetical protein